MVPKGWRFFFKRSSRRRRSSLLIQQEIYRSNNVNNNTGDNYQRWSPRGRPWPRGRPRGHILKSLALASRPQVLENWPVFGSRTALFFGKRFVVEIAWKIFVKTFFLESTCACVLGPLSSERLSLALASDFFVPLALALASSLVSSTPPLIIMQAYWLRKKVFRREFVS